MSAKKSDDRKTIVVVGGGAAGVNIARPLSAQLDASKYKLILINPKPYRILLPATLRLVVSDKDNLEESALVPYDKLFHNDNGTFVQGRVESIEQNAGETTGVIILRDGEKIQYDILVLAPGSLWGGPIAFPEEEKDVKPFIQDSREAFAKAKSIVLVGGGAVGIELAGELKDIWPDKSVTIVHGDRHLLNNVYPDKFRTALENASRARGVELVLGDYVDTIPAEGVDVVTRNGKTIKADLTVSTRGMRPNTEFILSLGSDVLTVKGFVKIQPTLQLVAYPNIFAAGDVIDWKEQPQAAKAGGHGSLITKNILNYIAGKPLKEYKGSYELIVVTNGKNSGVSYFGVLWGIVLGGWFSRTVKSKDLMVPLMQKQSGR